MADTIKNYEIIKTYCTVPIARKSNKDEFIEVNLMSWSKGPKRIDIRVWEQNHERWYPGFATSSKEDIKNLIKAINESDLFTEDDGQEETK